MGSRKSFVSGCLLGGVLSIVLTLVVIVGGAYLAPNGEIALRIRGSAKWDDISVAATLKLLSTVEAAPK